MNKIIFLDFDGVLNVFELDSFNSWTSDQDSLNREMIERVNHIIDATGAKVIVSSDWRHGRGVDRLQNLLDFLGFRGTVVDRTISDSDPNLSEEEKIIADSCRADQIAHAIIKHNIKQFVIIDDIHPGGLDDHLVLTNSYVGITDQDVIKSIEILNRV